MTLWLLVAPERDLDEALARTAWIARETAARAATSPIILAGTGAVRAALEQHLLGTAALSGLAFFGHGAEDRLFDADRPEKEDGPALLDGDNVGRLQGLWVHAFACWSGKQLAKEAVERGVTIYVGYNRPLDAGWQFPPSAAPEFLDLVTCTTLALQEGERDERALLARASRAADAFVLQLEALPDEVRTRGWMWLHALAQQLVDNMIVTRQ